MTDEANRNFWDEFLLPIVEREMEVLRRHGLIPEIDALVNAAEKAELLGLPIDNPIKD